MLVET